MGSRRRSGCGSAGRLKRSQRPAYRGRAMSQAAVARAMGLTVRQVQGLEASGLRKLRDGLMALGWTPDEIAEALEPNERRCAEPSGRGDHAHSG